MRRGSQTETSSVYAGNAQSSCLVVGSVQKIRTNEVQWQTRYTCAGIRE